MLADLTLGKNGFEICRAPLTWSSAELADQQVIQDTYRPEVERILKITVTSGFHKVLFFDQWVYGARPAKYGRAKLTILSACRVNPCHISLVSCT